MDKWFSGALSEAMEALEELDRSMEHSSRGAGYQISLGNRVDVKIEGETVGYLYADGGRWMYMAGDES